MRCSLPILAAAAALPMVAGPPAPAQIPDPPPREARPATLTELRHGLPAGRPAGLRGG